MRITRRYPILGSFINFLYVGFLTPHPAFGRQIFVCLIIACASVLRLGALACWRGARGRVPYMDRCGTQTTEGSNLTQW